MILRYIQRIQVLANPQELEVLEEKPVEEEEEELGKLPDVFMQRKLWKCLRKAKNKSLKNNRLSISLKTKPHLVAQQIRDWINES